MSDVTTYPSTRVRKGQIRWAKAFVSKGENEQSRHQRLFEENARKNKKMSASFKNKGSGVVYV